MKKGDIVKVVCEDWDKLGLISEVTDDKLIRIGKNWFELENCKVTILHES
jgi:hypothetical protein